MVSLKRRVRWIVYASKIKMREKILQKWAGKSLIAENVWEWCPKQHIKTSCFPHPELFFMGVLILWMNLMIEWGFLHHATVCVIFTFFFGKPAIIPTIFSVEIKSKWKINLVSKNDPSNPTFHLLLTARKNWQNYGIGVVFTFFFFFLFCLEKRPYFRQSFWGPKVNGK